MGENLQMLWLMGISKSRRRLTDTRKLSKSDTPAERSSMVADSIPVDKRVGFILDKNDENSSERYLFNLCLVWASRKFLRKHCCRI